MQLLRQNTPVSLYKARRLMKATGLKAIQPRSFVPRTTDSRHSYPISPNLLKDKPLPTSINQAWVGDITYLPLANGSFEYLSVWMDLCSRKIVGWDVHNHMRESLVTDSLNKALNQRRITAPLIIHSDRGGQYGSYNFRRPLASPLFAQSMSGRDNPYDNAHMESFFSRLKAELMEGKPFGDADHCRREIFEYIEMYYNTSRLHSSLGYRSPNECEKSMVENQPQ